MKTDTQKNEEKSQDEKVEQKVENKPEEKDGTTPVDNVPSETTSEGSEKTDEKPVLKDETNTDATAVNFETKTTENGTNLDTESQRLYKKNSQKFENKKNEKQKIKKEIKEMIFVRSLEDKENVDQQQHVNIDDYEESPEEEERVPFSSNSNLRIKFIVSEISKNPVEKNFKKIISPFVSKLNNAPDFGLFHVALAIGPWKVEFNNSQLCIPRTVSGVASLICADLETIATVNELDYVRDKLADVIIKWNTTMIYNHRANPQVENSGNCQHFIDDVLKHLGLAYKLQQVPPCLRSYFIRLRENGYGEMEMEPDYDFAMTFKIEHKRHIFTQHAQLDAFVIHLYSIEPDFEWRYKYEYYMLKSFDRAFWMKNLSVPNEKKYVPLQIKESKCSCPFGDPKRVSMIDFKVKL